MSHEDLNTERLPDLPELEYAEASSWSTGEHRPSDPVTRWLAIIGAVIAAAWVSSMLLWGLLRNWTYVLADQKSVSTLLAAAPVVAALVVWVVWRLLLGDYRWRTDPEGLTAISRVRTRFIRWDEVKSVELKQTPVYAEEQILVLETARGMLKLRGANITQIRLAASAWQHLRRAGRTDDSTLPSWAVSFWDVIPDQVPHEMDWVNPKPPRLKAIIAASVLGELAAVGVSIWLLFDMWLLAVPYFAGALFLPAAFASWIRRVRDTARSVVLRTDGLTAQTGAGRFEIRWQDVECAAIGVESLTIVTRAGAIAVPFQPESEPAGKLVLALMRALRAADSPQALLIPAYLRKQVPDGGSTEPEPAAVELRLSRAETLGVALPLVLFGTLMLVFGGTDPHPANRLPCAIAGVAILALAVFAWAAGARYSVTVDSTGISKRCLWWRRTVRWDEVAGVELRRLYKRSLVMTRALVSSERRSLISAEAGVGTTKDRARFTAAVDAHLARLSVHSPEWLARPRR